MTAIASSVDLRKGNRRRVLRAIRRGLSLSRTDISRETKLSAATVTAIVADLIDRKLLLLPDNPERSAGRGRPKVALALNPASAMVGTIVFKHNRISAMLVDYAGNVVAEHSSIADTAKLDTGGLRDLFVTCFSQTISLASGNSPLLRIAVGVQGTTDIGGHRILWSPVTQLMNLPVGDWLSRAFGVPVRVWNDCDMIANALHWQDPERYGSNFAAVLLSYGVGMGLFIDGRPMNGTHSSGMEFGHMTYIPEGAPCRCGKLGCIESYAADYAIGLSALGKPSSASEKFPDIDAVIGAARSGDLNALGALETAGKALGTGLASVFALMDDMPVALVGAGAAAFEFMESPLRGALRAGVAGKQGREIEIGCFPDDMPIIHKGCAISALLVLDGEITRWTTGKKVSLVQ